MLNKMIIWYEDNIVGRRTYIVAIVTAIITLLQVFNVVTLTPDQTKAVYGLLMALGLVTVRSAIGGE